MNTIFETVKTVVTPREASERYGLSVSQGGMAPCPFHPDRTPSMKLYADHFHCFGCGAYGDVIDLTGKLLDLDPDGSAARLAEDFTIDIGQNRGRIQKPNRTEIHRRREYEAYCFSVLVDYLLLLEHWKMEYAPASPSLPIDDRFAEACQMMDRIEYMADVLTFGSLEQRTELTENLSTSGMIQRLAANVRHRKEGEIRAGEQASA